MRKRIIIVAILLVFSAGGARVFPAHTAQAAPFETATLVRTTDLSLWSPPAPDPAGIMYDPLKNKLVIVDSEVEEMSIYQGKNMFEATLNGTLTATSDTTSFSYEPTDITLNPSNRHLFISDDDEQRIFEINPGPDGSFVTGDDTISSFSTITFNNADPEGVAYGDGKLYITDGEGSEIVTISPGANGIFEGVTPSSDDQITHFDISVFGITDPEGAAYNADSNTLFVVDYTRATKLVIEVTTQGNLVRSIDISQAGSNHPGGITYAPASNTINKKSLYIVDRAIDNDSNPNENDGKLYELSISSSVPTPTPIPGDVTGDDHVSILDLSILLSNFGKQGSLIQGDLNNDGVVNLSDLSTVLSNFGK